VILFLNLFKVGLKGHLRCQGILLTIYGRHGGVGVQELKRMGLPGGLSAVIYQYAHFLEDIHGAKTKDMLAVACKTN